MAKQLARQGIEQNLSPKQKRRPLPLLLSPSFFYGVKMCSLQKYPSHPRNSCIADKIITIIIREMHGYALYNCLPTLSGPN